ncbi:MAG: class I SAM-dependent DNA methyltransferase [Selenomonadaceae bacterium]|nr:class I SAM-dependent DNA methyltransferase [Selenomonadaceae bacterium]
MKESEQKKAAKAFAAKWAGIGDEKQHTQTFWLELLHDVYGVEEPFGFITFEDRVKLSHTSFIDATIPATHVMIEQKSLGKDLTTPIKQSDGTTLTPYQQAKRYAAELPYSKRPRWIIACNFAEFYIYDMENPQAAAECVLLKNLATEYYRLQFLVNVKSRDAKKEMELSLAAGEIVGKIYAALLAEYDNPKDAEDLKILNKLCVRLVFCLYANDAGVFGRRGMFADYLQDIPHKYTRQMLVVLFQILAMPKEKRDKYLDDYLAEFPYVDGGLFVDEYIAIPPFSDEFLNLLLNRASHDFDWSGISPTIFGAVFESTLNPVTRRAGGMHYTSIENIHKLIDPLFLDDLKKEWEEVRATMPLKTKKKRLEAFHEKLASLTFLDPACGSGNFLTETYISLRRLENELLKEKYGVQILMGDFDNPVKVSIGQFYGIEINDFAVAVAKAALWIAEAQMLQETEEIVHRTIDFFPIQSYSHIVEGNALRMDWESVLPKDKCSYIMGNPPFIGYTFRDDAQKEDMERIWRDEQGKLYKAAGKIDYVACWHFLAAKYMQGNSIKTAFVSTNSITQGEQVISIWKPLMERFQVHIDFAWRTFRWDSESNPRAQVHCVIIGFSTVEEYGEKFIYTEGKKTVATNINPYLLNAPTVFIDSRQKPICNVPEIVKGSQPTDDGNFFLTEAEKNTVITQEPHLEKYIRRVYGAKEYINNTKRYCFWLVGASPAEIKNSSVLFERVKNIREFRSDSPKEATRNAADTPILFQEIRQPNAEYILVPRVSSENRRYVPMGFLSAEYISTDSVQMIPNATLYHFGVLTSNVHMAWMRTVVGRLKSDYRYSNKIVYNNFPWPTPTDKQKAAIEAAAQGILDARKKYPESSLADLYDTASMPPELTKAHQANDRAVMAAYGFDVKAMTEAECVTRLMEMYVELTGKEQPEQNEQNIR